MPELVVLNENGRACTEPPTAADMAREPGFMVTPEVAELTDSVTGTLKLWLPDITVTVP
jgi:hypothetical protein